MERHSTNTRLGPNTIPRELLRKYQTSGPRYTSYPTAPQFTADVDWEEIARRWRASNAEGRGLSAYVHVPFCRSRCAYCGCHTTIGASDEELERYVDALLSNADWILGIIDASRPLEQLALGGGTPTHLSPSLLRRLVEGLRDRFTFAPSAERAIEVDPRWVDDEILELLDDLGFNRFSFGVQDLDATVQENVDRVLELEKLERLLTRLRALGHRSINLDLIYGLPGQTPESFAETIRKVVELRPSRIATFGYAHVPWVAPHQRSLERYGILEVEDRMKLFGLAFEMLLDAGYRHVGMDHFALPDDELTLALEARTLTRNFMGYTTRKGLDLVPLGASAIGAVAATYVQNIKEVGAFVEARPDERWARGFALSDEDVLRREVILELLCNFHLDTAELAERVGIDFDEHFRRELADLAAFEADGLVSVTPGQIDVTDLGRFFIRNITMVFDTYLRREADGAQRYSKTI